MSILHIVMVAFQPGVDDSKRQSVCEGFLALKDRCKNASTGKAYITSVVGGIDNSLEGVQREITHAFVVEFPTVADRAYYVNEDPVHSKFANELRDVASLVQVVDFTPGVFG